MSFLRYGIVLHIFGLTTEEVKAERVIILGKKQQHAYIILAKLNIITKYIYTCIC